MNRQTQNKNLNAKHPSRSGRLVAGEMTLWMCALALAVVSAIAAKERGQLPALAGIESSSSVVEQTRVLAPAETIEIKSTQDRPSIKTVVQSDEIVDETIDSSIRWFDGKMVRPAKTIYMTVTGYSPDARSCGKYADNKTATMYSVWTNGMDLVAADPRVLPYWSMISVPGYANDDIVPVLDCGGAIKGNRLDLLYPTHELALKWGVRQLPVTVWEYVENE